MDQAESQANPLSWHNWLFDFRHLFTNYWPWDFHTGMFRKCALEDAHTTSSPDGSCGGEALFGRRLCHFHDPEHRGHCASDHRKLWHRHWGS